jgi:hypothetical protein
MRRVLAIAALACFGAAGALGLRAGPPTDAGFVAGSDVQRRLEREITTQFGMERPVVWIVEGRAGTIWTPDVLERIQALTRAVFTIPGVVAPDVVSLASPNVRDVRVTEDGLTPVYLMSGVPRDAAAVSALRAKVDADPLLRGALVSLDGRAALVVANFRSDADARTIADHAVALRDRFRDGVTDTWVTGAPIVARTVRGALARIVPWIGGALLALAAIGIVLIGARHVLAAWLAALTTGLVTAAIASRVFEGTLAWTALAALPPMLMAARLAAGASRPPNLGLAFLGLGPGIAMATLAATADTLLRPFAAAAAGGFLVAPWTATLARTALAVVPHPRRSLLPAHVVALLVLGGSLGIVRLHVAFDPFGYGLRYLPAPARDDLAALGRDFPPPVSFAVRVRGEPGFVARPDVLQALDQITAATRADAGVQSATSLADLVKRVHRTFNDDRPEFERVPDEQQLIARYLALAYSPGFRRYVDRALATSTVWVLVRGSASLADVSRVQDTLAMALRAHPMPGGVVDPPAGDAAGVLRDARAARTLVRGALWALLVTAGLCLLVFSPAGVGRAFTAAMLAGLTASGMLGWSGLALDLVTIPIIIGLAFATFAGRADSCG